MSATTVDMVNLWLAASGLLSEQAENPEYDRAIVELVADLSGLSQEHKRSVYVALIAMAGRSLDLAPEPYPDRAEAVTR